MLIRSKSIVCPARKSGYDSGHLAVGRPTRFSGISGGGNFISLVPGSIGTITGSPTAITNGNIGQATKFTAFGSDQSAFSGNTTSNPTSATLGGIFVVDTTQGSGNYNTIFSTDGSNSGGWVPDANGSTLVFEMNTPFAGSPLSSGITLSTATPYFAAVSVNGSSSNWVVVNLSNGVIQTATAGGQTPASGNGTYLVGNHGSNRAGISTAAVMFSEIFLPMALLIKWAYDPWSFWYPTPGPTIDIWGGTPPAAVIDTLGTPIYRVQPQRWGW